MGWAAPSFDRLPAKAEFGDEASVALDVLSPEVLEQAATATYEEQKAATGVVILGMGLGVLGQIGDPAAEERDLDLG